MIPSSKQDIIAKKLVETVGIRKDVGDFLFVFSSLEPSRDIEYALDEINNSTDLQYKKAIRIVLDEIVK